MIRSKTYLIDIEFIDRLMYLYVLGNSNRAEWRIASVYRNFIGLTLIAIEK